MGDSDTYHHVANVMSTLQRGGPHGATVDEWLRQSWHRSVAHHRLDPGRSYPRKVLSGPEVREASDRLGLFLDVAKPHIDELERQVSAADYCILLTDASGLTIACRGGNDPDSRFKKAGVRVGSCWSEQTEGTCGIGTAIINQAPTLVHKTEHFRADNIPLSCSAAPVFGLEDELIGVLDASTLYSPQARDSQALVFNLVNARALAIENAYAERALQAHWRLSLAPRCEHRPSESILLMAFNDDGLLVGANRAARQLLSGPGATGAGQAAASLSGLFGCTLDELLVATHRLPGTPLPLRLVATGAQMYGLLQAPAARPAARAAGGKSVPGAAPTADASRAAFAHLATGDRQVQEIITRACRVANRNLPVMLLGETGTGKEAFAKALHQASQRHAKPFVAMNCAAIPESLIESELFGYREGAFTGARSRGAKGKIAQADGGTLFLDEIGDMPLLLQSRLLRVLAEGEVLPLGAEEPVAVALQVVCATHQSLTDLVRQGRFREDLYYRLLGAVFHLPPLRDREDIGTIIRHLLDEECAAMGRPWAQLDREAMAFLKRCPWPGNIRQLRLAIRYACAISDGEWLSVADFPRELLDDAPANAAPTVAVAVAPAAAAAPAAIPCPTSADERQREDMLEALRRHKWRVGHAARELEVPRSTFYRRMAKLCIVPPNQA